MKYKIQKKFNKQLFKQQTLILLLISTQNCLSHIANNENKTQIQIYSNDQNINMMTNTLTIIGNVVIQINSINIYADKISIIYSNKNNKEKIINAYGNPVIFYRFEKNKKQILATSLHMSYKTDNDILTLKNKVYLKQENLILQSECIIIKNKYIATCNNQRHLNKTIFTLNINKNHTNIQSSLRSSNSIKKTNEDI